MVRPMNAVQVSGNCQSLFNFQRRQRANGSNVILPTLANNTGQSRRGLHLWPPSIDPSLKENIQSGGAPQTSQLRNWEAIIVIMIMAIWRLRFQGAASRKSAVTRTVSLNRPPRVMAKA